MGNLILRDESSAARARYRRTMRRMMSTGIRHVDGAMASALLTLGLVEAAFLTGPEPRWMQIALTFVWTVPLVWRRRWPVAVLALVIVMGPLLSLVNSQGGVTSFVLAAILAAYTVGRELDAPETWWGPVLTVGFGWVVFGATGGELSDFVFVAVLYGGAWAVGYVIRRRDLQVGQLTREADELRRNHAAREQHVIEQERARIARELHDIVSHSISVITIQSQVVRRQLDPTNSAEVEALRSIELTARQAMAEMRRLLGVLRAREDALVLTPQPGLSEMTFLITEARAAGIELTLVVEGNPVPVPPGIGLTAYRVVQEALTNVRKHTLATTAQVLLRYHPDTLEILVSDDGPERPAVFRDDGLSAGGYGLAGMRERVTLYSGRVSVGHHPEGGFRVHAYLPLSRREVVQA
ncbi:sensor histidine kinase [soil metagenome]